MNKVDNALTAIRKILVNIIIGLAIILFLPIVLLLVFREFLEESLSEDNIDMITLILLLPVLLAQFAWIGLIFNTVFNLLGG